jgi:hypothetical protein
MKFSQQQSIDVGFVVTSFICLNSSQESRFRLNVKSLVQRNEKKRSETKCNDKTHPVAVKPTIWCFASTPNVITPRGSRILNQELWTHGKTEDQKKCSIVLCWVTYLWFEIILFNDHIWVSILVQYSEFNRSKFGYLIFGFCCHISGSELMRLVVWCSWKILISGIAVNHNQLSESPPLSSMNRKHQNQEIKHLNSSFRPWNHSWILDWWIFDYWME